MARNVARTIIIMLVAFSYSVPTLADWSAYRHDARRSGMTDTKVELPLTIAWRYRTPHPPRPAWEDPARHNFWHRFRELLPHIIFDRAPQLVTSAGRVYFGDTVDDTIRCLDLSTGRTIWSFPTGGPIRCAPTVYGDRVLVGSDDGRVYCLNALTGRLLWAACPKETSRLIADGRLISCLPIRTDILIDHRAGEGDKNQIAYFGAGLFPKSEGALLCSIDIDKGKILSTVSTDRPIQGYLAKRDQRVVTPAGRYAPGGAEVSASDTAGMLKWHPVSGGPGGVFAMISERLIVNGPGVTGRLALFDVQSDTAITELPGVWMLVDGDRFYIQTLDTMYALDGLNYCRLTLKIRALEKECEQIKRRGEATAAVEIAKRQVDIAKLNMERAACELWRVESDNPYTMIMADKTIFVGGPHRISAYDSQTGKRLWQTEVEGRAYGLAVDDSGKLLVSTDEGIIYAFETDRRGDISKPTEVSPTIPDKTTADSILEVLPLSKEASDGSTIWHFMPRYLTENGTFRPVAGSAEIGAADRTANSAELSKYSYTQVDRLTALLHPGRAGLSIDPTMRDQILPEKDFTVEALLRVDKELRWGGIVGAIQDNGSYERGWLLGFENRNFSLATVAGSGSKLTYMTADEPMTLGRWHYVVATYDGSTMKLFVDGRRTAQSTAQSGPIRYPEHGRYDFIVGSYKDDNEDYRLSGAITRVGIHHRVMTEDEIKKMSTAICQLVPRQSIDVPARLLTRETDRIELEWPTRFGENSQLLYGPADSLPPKLPSEMVTINHCRIATIDNLRPDTRYAYRIVANPDNNVPDETSKVHYFRTRPDAATIIGKKDRNRSEKLGQWTSRALSLTDSNRGFCLVPQPVDPQIAIEIAAKSNLHIVLFHDDVETANRWRRELADAHLLGRAVSVHSGTLDSLPPYFADLIIADPRNANAAIALDPTSVLRLLRPEGGVMLYPTPTRSTEESRSWTDALTAMHIGTPQAGIDTNINGFGQSWLLRRGPLEGAGRWDHGIADLGNTACSGDRLVGGPMRLLWFGPPGPRNMVDRHHRNPAPLYRDGRLFIPGDQTLTAVNAYNGTPLWDKKLLDSRRLGVFLDCSNLAVDDSHFYFAVGRQCRRFQVDDGREIAPLTIPEEDTSNHWGYLAIVTKPAGKIVVGSVTKPSAAYTEMSREGENVLWYDAMKLVTSDRLFALNPSTGLPVWNRSFAAVINSTITSGDGRVYFLQSLNPAAAADPLGRSTMKVLGEEGLRLVALDLKSGKTLWQKEIDPSYHQYIAYLSYADGRLVLSGNRYVEKRMWYSIECLDASSANSIWRADHQTGFGPGGAHGEQNRHPTIVGDRVYAFPFAYDLKTGNRIPNWRFDRGGHGCGNVSASTCSLFIRGGNPRQLDLNLETSPRPEQINSVSRPGCWINMIPAGGLLMIPEASSGCTCRFPIQTTLTYVPACEIRE